MPGVDNDFLSGLSTGFFTPGDVLNEMVTIDNAARVLATDINTTKREDEAFKKFSVAYAVFWKEWLDFYSESQAWLNRAKNAVRDKVVLYREQLRAWQAKARALGIAMSSPDLPQEKSGFAAVSWNGLAWITAGVVIGYLVLTRNRE